MNAAQRGIDDQHELAVHAIRIGKPQRVIGAEIVNGAIACAGSDQTPSRLLERCTACSSEGEMIEMSALEHRRVGVGVQPRLRADSQHRVFQARHGLSEYDFETESVSVKSDESLEIARHDGDVIETGDCLHAAMVQAMDGSR